MDRDIIETRGAAALKRLYQVAQADYGQCRYIAHFLLGLYNGTRFPFDLTELRAIDDALFEECMTVLRMDARVTRQEVHRYFAEGGQSFEQLAKDWDVEDMEKVRENAQRAAKPAGTPVPLHEGGRFEATLHGVRISSGYRDVQLVAQLGEQGNTEVELNLTAKDAENLAYQIVGNHAAAWDNNGDRGPMDKQLGEKRPDWLDKAPAKWNSF